MLVVTLRPRGRGRFVVAAFLSVWVAGWAVSVAALLAGLGWLVQKTDDLGLAAVRTRLQPSGVLVAVAVAIALVVLAFVALWAWAGVTAIRDLLRVLAGRDEVSVDVEGVALRTCLGPFCSTRRWAMRDVEDAWLRRRDRALVLRVRGRNVGVTLLGTPDERTELLAQVKARLVRSAEPPQVPSDWRETVLPDGSRRLVRSRALFLKQLGCSGFVLVPLTALLAWMLSEGSFALVPLAAMGVLLGLLMLGWTVGVEDTWVVRRGLVVRRRRRGTRVREERCEGGRLVVRRTTDSDGDDWHVLVHVADGVDVELAGRTTDAAGLDGLGRWLARHSGLPYEAPEDVGR